MTKKNREWAAVVSFLEKPLNLWICVVYLFVYDVCSDNLR